MRTLILYATKYGATADIARRIASKIDGASAYDIKQDNIPDISGFDRILIGSSVYAGSTRKEAKAYVAQNAAALTKKEFGLFFSGLGADPKTLEKNFPPGFVKRAKSVAFMGGIFDPDKINGAERLALRAMYRLKEYTNSIDDEAIDQFVAAMKE